MLAPASYNDGALSLLSSVDTSVVVEGVLSDAELDQASTPFSSSVTVASSSSSRRGSVGSVTEELMQEDLDDEVPMLVPATSADVVTPRCIDFAELHCLLRACVHVRNLGTVEEEITSFVSPKLLQLVVQGMYGKELSASRWTNALTAQLNHLQKLRESKGINPFFFVFRGEKSYPVLIDGLCSLIPAEVMTTSCVSKSLRRLRKYHTELSNALDTQKALVAQNVQFGRLWQAGLGVFKLQKGKLVPVGLGSVRS